MKADARFISQSKTFWANVRTISEQVGYTARGTKSIRVPTLPAIRKGFNPLGLTTEHIASRDDVLTEFGSNLFAYFNYRAEVLNGTVQNQLMTKHSAEEEFTRLKDRLNPRCPLPMNKQTQEKKNCAFLTGIVNMLIEASIDGAPCDYDPRGLTTITDHQMPLRTLARRVDGAFPSIVNPIAIWEIKEYYYTTTFGSRVADGVYESLLDGLELEELEQVAGRRIQHVLFVDDHFTWWESGRSYLCRLVDMLHMGYADEIMFGREVLVRLPELAKSWKVAYEATQREG